MIFAFPKKKKHKNHFSSSKVPLCIPFYARMFSVDCSFPDFYVSKIFKRFKQRLCCRIKVFFGLMSVEVRRGMHWSDRSAAWWSPLVSINARGARCVAHKRPILNLADVKQLQFRRLSNAARGFGNPQWLVERAAAQQVFEARANAISPHFSFPSSLLVNHISQTDANKLCRL